MARVTLTLLILAALAAVLIGCGAGGGGSSQQSAERRAAKSSEGEPPGQKPEDTGAPEGATGDKLSHPALGSADAPVVLIEYGDYQ